MTPRASLLRRKDELYDSIRTLSRDLDDGAIDLAAFTASRTRLETEAAAILEQLDRTEGQDEEPSKPILSRRAILVGSLGVLAIAMVFFLMAALHDRPPATSSLAPPTPTISSAVLEAQQGVVDHPHSAGAAMSLGTAELNSGDAVSADTAFRRAMSLSPNDPAPPTMDALALSAAGDSAGAFARLRSVETKHPRYARAWLVDGLLPDASPAGRSHAITALKKFLTLQPTGSVAASVRRMIVRLEKSP